MLPVASGWFLHLVVLYGHRGADSDVEQLALTEQLFDAALVELGVVALDQPCLIVGDFSVEPTKIPCLAEGISAGLRVDLEVSWSLAAGKQPASTCKRTWGCAGGHCGDFMVGCALAAAAVASCFVQPDKWIERHLAVGTYFEYAKWTCRVILPVQRTPLWPASWLLALDKKVEALNLPRCKGLGRFMMTWCNLWQGMSLHAGDVSRAWLVWSSAAETAPADAYRFAGGPVPQREPHHG